MRKKYFFTKIFAPVFLSAAVALYFFFYFLPSLETINRYRRQVKDMNLKIADSRNADITFSFPTRGEERYFLRLERELNGKIPRTGGREDFNRLFGRISGYIRKQAELDGIDNLVIEGGPGGANPGHGTLLRIAAPRLKRMWQERQTAAEQRTQTFGSPDNGMDSDLSALVKGIRRQSAAVIFSGELKNALDFINHLSWGPYYLAADKIVAAAGDGIPYYIVFLNIYYTGDRGTGLTPATVPRPAPDGAVPSAPGQQEKDRQGLIVDPHSRMSLRPIPAYLAKKYPRRELPREFGKINQPIRNENIK